MEQKNQIGLSTGRIEAFTDGVIAVAITLLILEIKVPHIEYGGSLWQALVPLWPKFLAYAVSFGIIGIFWAGHHIMFHYIKRTDRTLLWLNNLLLMFVCAIPFSAAFVGEHLNETTAIVFYGAVLFLAGLMFTIIWQYASRHHRLLSPTLPKEMVRLGTLAVAIAPIIYALAILMAFVNPNISKGIYLLVPILYIIPSPIDKLVHFKDSE